MFSHVDAINVLCYAQFLIGRAVLEKNGRNIRNRSNRNKTNGPQVDKQKYIQLLVYLKSLRVIGG
jgi:hypothetical protein